MSRELACIYALVDPRSGQERYVGLTVDPARRLTAHIAAARKGNCPRDRWIREVLASGARPRVVVLEEVARSNARERELWWIREMMRTGKRLTNKEVVTFLVFPD